MDISRIRFNTGCLMLHGGRLDRRERGCEVMLISFGVVGTALASFAEGAILAASVYLVSRGVKNPLRNRKK